MGFLGRPGAGVNSLSTRTHRFGLREAGMAKRLVVGVLAIGLLVIVAIVANDDLGLEVRSESFSLGSLVTIKNIGTGSTHILDISVNDREECSTFPNPYNAQRYKESKDQLHQLWIHGDYPNDNNQSAATAKELRVGDSLSLETRCGVVRVAVTTDKGVETFTFK